MFPGSRYYAIKDCDGGSTGAIEVHDEAKLSAFNERGYGIFFSVNAFDGARQIPQLSSINAWYCETDDRDKGDVFEQAMALELRPTLINESKNGLHMYWRCIGDATEGNYRRIQEALARTLEGDDLKDVTRVLRVPGFAHLKDPADPFIIRTIFSNPEYVYSESEMLYYFAPSVTDEVVPTRLRWAEMPRGIGKSWKTGLVHVPVELALRRLSGSEYVRGDIFEVFENGNGTAQIWVNGKKSSSWIDEDGKIGSWKRWGPSIYTWLLWYARREGQGRHEALADEMVEARVKEAAQFLFGSEA